MGDSFDSKKFGSIVALGPFTQENVTSTQTNADLAYGQATLAAMPYAGSVIGVSALLNGAVTGGTCIVRAHKAGTEFAEYGYPSATLSSAASTSYGTAVPGAVTFSAGDRLGLSITTGTTYTPETAELDGWLFVQLNAS